MFLHYFFQAKLAEKLRATEGSSSSHLTRDFDNHQTRCSPSKLSKNSLPRREITTPPTKTRSYIHRGEEQILHGDFSQQVLEIVLNIKG